MIIYRILLIIFFLSCMGGTVYGSPQDYIDENKEDALQGAELIPAKGNFVAVPIPISNPTVGTGLQAALLYLHPKKDTQPQNSTSGIVGMYTDSNSWLAGIFHDGYWAPGPAPT